MTDGRDEADESRAESGSRDRRDDDPDGDSGWDRPWPGEVSSEEDRRETRRGDHADRGRETDQSRLDAGHDRPEGDDSSFRGTAGRRDADPDGRSRARQPRTDTPRSGRGRPEGRGRRQRNPPARERAGSGTGSEHDGRRTGVSDNPVSDPVERRDGASVYVAEDVQNDEEWVDLGEHRPAGEALAAADLSAEELREYVTDRRSLHPLVQVHWGIRITLGALVLGLVASWILGTLGYNPQIAGAVAVGLVVLGLVWVVLYYRLWVYQVRADAIYLERGVVTHVRSLVPYVRIQHVDTSQSPIERFLGLSTLVVYTAGSRGADVSIPGLLPDEARDLQRRVKELAIEAEGDDAL